MTQLAVWITAWPTVSIERLGHVNHAATSASHVILALSYGLSDRHIRRLNKMIVGLLLSRMKAQRRGDVRLAERIESKLQDVHEAIDRATGTPSGRQSAGNACARVR